MQNSQNQRKAYLLTLLAVLFWSTVGSAIKITLRYLNFDNLLFWSVLGGIFVLGVLNQLGKNPLRFRLLSRKAWLSSAVMGFLNPFLYYLVLIKAYQLLEAQVAGTLNYIWPIVLVLFSIPFLGQKIKARAVVAIFISFFGILIISTGGHPFLLNYLRFTGEVERWEEKH